MDFKRFGNRYLIRIDRGEEIVQSLKDFCGRENVRLASVAGIGAADRIVVGLFDTKQKEYFSRRLEGDHEITSLAGNVSTMNGETYLHLHVNVCDRENRCFGGHLNSAVVSGTFEGFIDLVEGDVDREKDEDVGLNLIRF